jgi:hypothetical protein
VGFAERGHRVLSLTTGPYAVWGSWPETPSPDGLREDSGVPPETTAFPEASVTEVTVHVSVPVVVPVADAPCASALASVSTIDMDSFGMPASYPLRLGAPVNRGLKSPVVRRVPVAVVPVLSETMLSGTLAETPRVDESLRMIVCTVGVGFPSGPRMATVVMIVEGSAT